MQQGRPTIAQYTNKIPQTKSRISFYRLKEWRNLIRNYLYVRKHSKSSKQVVNKLKMAGKTEICLTIAFNTPWTIDLQIECWQKFCPDTTLLVADNSNKRSESKIIESICADKKILYIKLPTNPVKHPSRSHGLALNWVWQNIILRLENLQRIGLIDHDCYPIKPCRPNHLSNSLAHGVAKSSWIQGSCAKNIWAGFTFFANQPGLTIKDFDFNFLPDPINGLDTGGMNWQRVYQHIKSSDMTYAKETKPKAADFFKNLSLDPNWEINLIEERFIHLSGASIKKESAQLGRRILSSLLKQHLDSF